MHSQWIFKLFSLLGMMKIHLVFRWVIIYCLKSHPEDGATVLPVKRTPAQKRLLAQKIIFHWNLRANLFSGAVQSSRPDIKSVLSLLLKTRAMYLHRFCSVSLQARSASTARKRKLLPSPHSLLQNGEIFGYLLNCLFWVAARHQKRYIRWGQNKLCSECFTRLQWL